MSANAPVYVSKFVVSHTVASSTILYAIEAHADNVSVQVKVIVVDPATQDEPFGSIDVVGASLSCVLFVLVLHAVSFHKLSFAFTK